MHQRAGAVLDVNGRYPRRRSSNLQNRATGHHGFNHPFAKPGAVAIDPSGKTHHNRQSAGDVSAEAIERRRQTPATRRGLGRCVFGDGPRSWSDLWSIFVPEGATSTLAALPAAEQEPVFAEWQADSVVAALGAWLSGRR